MLKALHQQLKNPSNILKKKSDKTRVKHYKENSPEFKCFSDWSEPGIFSCQEHCLEKAYVLLGLNSQGICILFFKNGFLRIF